MPPRVVIFHEISNNHTKTQKRLARVISQIAKNKLVIV